MPECRRFVLPTTVVALLLLLGCQGTKEGPQTPDPRPIGDIGSSEAREWRLEDKREVVTPCTIGGTPVASFDLAFDTVDILNYYIVDNSVVVLARWSSDDVCRFVRITPSITSSAIGYEAEILTGQVLLYGVHVEFDMADYSSVSVREYTLDDELQITLESLSGGAVAESYSFNQTAPFTFDRDADPNADDVSELAAQIQTKQGGDVDDIFGYGSTLYDQYEGDRLVSLVESFEFAQWMYNQSTSGSLVVSMNRWTISNWVSSCTMAKCLFGGLANPVCATCTVVGGGLLITKAFVSLIDSSAWPEGL